MRGLMGRLGSGRSIGVLWLALVFVLTTISLPGCGGPTPVAAALVLIGTLLTRRDSPQPVPQVNLVLSSPTDGQVIDQTNSDGSGRFSLALGRPSSGTTYRITIADGSGRWQMYEIRYVGNTDQDPEVYLYRDVPEIGEITDVQAVWPADPLPEVPRVTSHADGDEVDGPAPPALFMFGISGFAGPEYGLPNSPYFVYPCITPVDPSGGGTFPQFQDAPVRVDPGTGAWTAQVQLGDPTHQAQKGDTFEILVVVTTEKLLEGTQQDPLVYDRPIDIDGVVYVSSFINLKVGDRL